MGAQHALEALQQRGLAETFVGQAEPGHRQPEQILFGHLRRVDAGDRVGFRVHLRAEPLDQGRLAGADFAGDDDKALALGEAIVQMGNRLAVPAAAEKESAVRRQLERHTR